MSSFSLVHLLLFLGSPPLKKERERKDRVVQKEREGSSLLKPYMQVLIFSWHEKWPFLIKLIWVIGGAVHLYLLRLLLTRRGWSDLLSISFTKKTTGWWWWWWWLYFIKWRKRRSKSYTTAILRLCSFARRIGSLLGTRGLLGAAVSEMMFRDPGLVQNHLSLFITMSCTHGRFSSLGLRGEKGVSIMLKRDR
jgi:hypothetical protein